MPGVGKCGHVDRLQRALAKLEERHIGVGTEIAKALRQDLFTSHTRSLGSKGKGCRGTRGGQRYRENTYQSRAKEELGSHWDWGQGWDTADLRPPQALAACLPAGSHAQDPAHPALWLLSSPAKGPLCPAWTWSWWAVATACR